ncbi:hypothetical protein [Saccharothrix coeruleofusca]|uniref:Uncharacterized protein n=1 Tax=Saccharothrix coeruleofusca TaxID=33919 RepID=A0A918ECU0_9PSEU|nr:hypothetical protein [Saccharothrix coeruleofusca]MBP2339942.1 hypothetical protein [Saccharothrix coeruleofusca]GGP38466.1 hypothetical protein GCM10010185_07430 [Saccharothrix coeruleofusca]
MSAFFRLEPEVAGELVDGTVLDAAASPPRVESVHFEITEWLGDDLVTSFPVFLVSEELATELVEGGLDGFRVRQATVTVTDEAQELLEGRAVPTFRWLDVTGQAGVDDVGVTEQGELVVSEEVLELFQAGTLENCEVERY